MCANSCIPLVAEALARPLREVATAPALCRPLRVPVPGARAGRSAARIIDLAFDSRRASCALRGQHGRGGSTHVAAGMARGRAPTRETADAWRGGAVGGGAPRDTAADRDARSLGARHGAGTARGIQVAAGGCSRPSGRRSVAYAASAARSTRCCRRRSSFRAGTTRNSCRWGRRSPTRAPPANS